MKRLILFLLFVVICYSAFIDISQGTLDYLTPEQPTEPSITAATNSTSFEYTVKSGDTLITIIENQLDRSLPVSIDTLINDFKKLNDGLEPTNIQAGKTYYFPNYKQNGI